MPFKKTDTEELISRNRYLQYLPFALVFLAFVCSTVGLYIAWNAVEERNRIRFENRTLIITGAIEDRIGSYLMALRGGRGVIYGHKGFEREAFHDYVQSLKLDTYYPGILGVGFSRRIQDSGKEALEEWVRQKTGNAGFRIWPEGEREEYHAIVYLSPLNKRNREAIGYDMFTEPVRREGMTRAAETGLPAASGRVTLVQEIGPDVQPGFLIYVPVYRGGQTPATVEDRRRLLEGFVYSPFRAHDLLKDLFREEAFSYVHFEIYDGTNPVEETKLYDTSPAGFKKEEAPLKKEVRLNVAGRPWTVRFGALPERNNLLPLALLTEGLLFLILFFILFLLGRTQRHLARKTANLAEAESRFRMVVEADPNGLILFNRNGLILLTNRSTERLFGYSRSELKGMRVGQLTGVDVEDLKRMTFSGSGREPVLSSSEITARTKGGETFPAEMVVNPIDSGSDSLFVAVLVDISEKKMREDEIRRRNEELLRSNEELEQFAYVASHDLQEPLKTISSFSELITMQMQERMNDEEKVFLEHIREAAVQAQRLIGEVLEYALIGRNSMDFEVVDLKEVMQEILRGMTKTLKKSQAEVRTGPLPVVLADRSQMTQLLQNLIQNAVKYRHPDRVLQVEVTASETDHAWVLAVKDNGIGISPEYHQKIFKIFQRLHTKKEYPGTGIGLAICKKIVDGHGGNLWVESERGRGSTFFFFVPKRPPASLPAGSAAETRSAAADA